MLRAALLVLLLSLSQAAYAGAPGACAAAFGASPPRAPQAANVRPWLARIRGAIPFFYFDPLPQTGFPLDSQAVDAAKTAYAAELRDLAEDPRRALSVPHTNEEKVALLEAVAQTVARARLATESLQAIRARREKDLVKLVKRWRTDKAPLTQEKLNRLFDLHYLAANADAIRLLKLDSLAHPSETILGLARKRWESVVSREDMSAALEKLGLLSGRAPVADTLRSGVDRLVRFAGRAFVNVNTFLIFHVPALFPGFSAFDYAPFRQAERQLWEQSKTDEQQAEQGYLARFQKVHRFEFFRSWAAKVWPYVVSAVVAANVVSSYEQITGAHDVAVATAAPGSVESRENVENALDIAMMEAYQTSTGAWPDAQVRASIKEYIKGLKLGEIADLRDRLKKDPTALPEPIRR